MRKENTNSRRSGTLMYTAYQTIKEEICTGAIRSGELLSETQLAARLGISRTPPAGGPGGPGERRPGRD